MSNCNYLEQIIKFNSDKDIIALREKYKEPTFFEIISKQRSETTYSSFLKWMFQSSSTDLNTVSPILLLLDILVKRGVDQERILPSITLINDELKQHIINRNFKINNIEVETEKFVRNLAQACLDSYNGNEQLRRTDIEDRHLKEIAEKCQDRIDIFINCEIEIDKNKTESLQIIIENKIDSIQGGSKNNKFTPENPYNTASQTNRYYMATARNDIKQIFVYLLPKSSDCTRSKINDKIKELDQKIIELSNKTTTNKTAKKTIADLEKDKTNILINENFIEIYYQDIVDGIIIPMLSSTTLSTRERFFLEELKSELTFPSLEGDNIKDSIASSNDNMIKFTSLWNENNGYKDLVTSAALETSESDIYGIDGYYYNYQPKKELIKACLSKNLTETLKNKDWIRDEKTNDICNELIYNGKSYYYKSSTWYSKIQEVAKNLGIVTLISKPKDEKNPPNPILQGFWNNNKRFLLALMSGLDETETQKIQCLTQEVSKRDTTKYWVRYNGHNLNKKWLKGKTSNISETAWLIIKAWAELRNESKIDLSTLREAFTRTNSNTYYSSGKYFSHLFYEYNNNDIYIPDGTDYEDENGNKKYNDKDEIMVKAGGWDFYKTSQPDDKKFRISTKEGADYAIMLKMWRKDGLQKLIDLVTDNKDYFKNGELTVHPDK